MDYTVPSSRDIYALGVADLIIHNALPSMQYLLHTHSKSMSNRLPHLVRALKMAYTTVLHSCGGVLLRKQPS